MSTQQLNSSAIWAGHHNGQATPQCSCFVRVRHAEHACILAIQATNASRSATVRSITFEGFTSSSSLEFSQEGFLGEFSHGHKLSHFQELRGASLPLKIFGDHLFSNPVPPVVAIPSTRPTAVALAGVVGRPRSATAPGSNTPYRRSRYNNNR